MTESFPLQLACWRVDRARALLSRLIRRRPMARSLFVAALLAAVPFTFIDARPAALAPRPAVAQADTVSLAWVTVPAGTFEMGCVPGDGQCMPQERPRHTI